MSLDAQNSWFFEAKGSNFRIHPGNVTQTEVFIENCPIDPNVLFVSCNTLTFIPFFISEGIYVSSDAGQSWMGNDTCTGTPISFHGGDPGITIDKNGKFILTRLGNSPFAGLYSHYSTDHGQSWSTQQVISTDDLERATMASDIFPASPFYGRSYAAWVKFAPPYPLVFSYTDNGGQSWSSAQPINNPPARCAGGDITTGPFGEIYICWAGVTTTSPFKEEFVGFAASEDGGQNWTVTENAFAMNGITGILPEKANIRVNGLPAIAVDTATGPRKGWIYIVTGQKELLPAGSDPDIIFYRSTDKGASWSSGIRVNQDGLNNGKIQYFPSIHVDAFGGLHVIYYDDRNTSSDSTAVFLAYSINGGDSWTETEVSDHHFKPIPIGGLGQGYQGDNIDITSIDSTLWPVWMDNSSGIYQIWTSPLDFSPVNATSEYFEIPKFNLEQNVPNPFQHSTQISYHIFNKGKVKLQVFDILGNEIETLVDKAQVEGRYTFNFSIQSLKGGIFYCRLEVNGRSMVRKMVLIDY